MNMVSVSCYSSGRTAVRFLHVSSVAQTRGRGQEVGVGQASTSGRSDAVLSYPGQRRVGGGRAVHAAISNRSMGAREMDLHSFRDHSGQQQSKPSAPTPLQPRHKPAVTPSEGLAQDHLRHDAAAPAEDWGTKPAVPTVVADREEPAEPVGEQGGGPLSKIAMVAAPLGFVAGLALVLGGGYLFKDQIALFIDFFVQLVEEWGPGGFLVYGLVYTALEVLALPAIPLTMTAGMIFGTVPGTLVVSVASTLAAAFSFLIARYLARDKVAAFAEKNPKFKAIDKAIGRNGFKVVTLLRMSPLLPLAASSYLYGLSSVDLGPYVLGSWLGMLPGTIAYVAAGSYGRALLGPEGNVSGVEPWQVALGAAFTLGALLYVGRLATEAVQEEERQAEAEQ